MEALQFDDRQHKAFDKSLLPASLPSLPSSTVRRLLFTYRTVYSVALCLVASYYRDFGGVGTYIAPLLSAVIATLYLGDCMPKSLRVTYGVLVGSGLGVLVGFTYEIPVLQVALLFVTIVFVNRCSAWDQSAKVFAGLSACLTALWPNITEGQYIGSLAYRYSVAISEVPFAITILTLIFPIPALAIEAARVKSAMLCRELSSMVTVLVRGFIVQDFHDLYSANFDVLHKDAEEGIAALTALVASAEYEVLIFPFEEDRVEKMKSFQKMAASLLTELEALRDMLNNIQKNTTQAKYVETLAVHLEDIAAELTISLRLVSEELSTDDTIEARLLSIPLTALYKLLGIFYGRDLSGEDSFDRRRSSTLTSMIQWAPSEVLIARRLAELARRKFNSNHVLDSRRDSVIEPGVSIIDINDAVDVSAVLDQLEQQYPVATDEPVDVKVVRKRRRYWRVGEQTTEETRRMRTAAFNDSQDRLKAAQKNLVDEYMETRRVYTWTKPEGYVKQMSPDSLSSLSDDDSGLTHKRRLRKRVSTKDFKVLVDENNTMRNLNPRGAYIHRLNDLLSIVESYNKIFTTKAASPWPKPVYSYASNNLSYVISYASYSIKTPLLICYLAINRCVSLLFWHCRRVCSFRAQSRGLDQRDSPPVAPRLVTDEDIVYIQSLARIYRQPVKIALAVVVASMFVVVRSLRDSQQNGLWAVIVITLIRQDATSSSFLVGYQRIEGTVMGAVYAFTAYQTLNCSSVPENCTEKYAIPVLLAWLAFCAYFREGPRHGYASIVAGFTPIVLFIGPVSGTTEGAWLRVQKTFVGVAIYLFIDNAFFPNRTDSVIRADVLASLDETLGMFNHVISAVKQLVDLGKNRPSEVARKKFIRQISTKRSTSSSDINKLSLKLAPIATTRPSSGSYSENSTDEASSNDIPADVFDTSSGSLSAADKHIASLKVILARQIANLKIVIHDPELWQRPFPLAAYTKLVDSFKNLLRSGHAVSRGAAAFHRVLEQMALQNEDVWQQLHFYEFMSKRIFAVVSRTDTALRMTSEALHRLYEVNDVRIDLSPLITLSHYFDRLLSEVDSHFKCLFIATDAPPVDVNPWFLLAWQNIFEAMCDLVRHLSALGRSLHNVRSIEAINSS